MKVLLVDDEWYVINGMKKLPIWEKTGVEKVLTAHDGQSALELIRSEKPDLLITDLYMPGLSGLELIRKTRELDKDIPIIVLSGYNNFNDISEAMVYGVVRYILKPSVPEELECIISETLDESILRRAQRKAYETFIKNPDLSLAPLQESFAMQLLLHGLGTVSPETLKRRLQFLKIDESLIDSGVVACIRIFYNSEESEQDRIGTLMNAIQLIKRSLLGGCFCQIQEDLFAVILPVHSAIQDLRQWPARLLSALFEQTRIEAAIGISDTYAGIHHCRSSYKHSLTALECAEEQGLREAVFYDDLSLSNENEGLCMKKVTALINIVSKGNSAQIQENWEELRGYMQACRSKTILQTTALCLISGVTMMISERYPECASGINIAESLQEVLSNSLSSSQLLGILDHKIKTMCSLLDSFFSSKLQHPYVTKLKEFIAQHYSESISLHELAQQMHLSRNYLSNVFTKSEGMSFVSYLTRYRLEKAKELFRTTALLTNEVGRKVGYMDPAYFSRVFKQAEGISPQEYVRQLLEQQKNPRS